MQAIRALVKLSEHCPECGALLVRVGRAGVCPHCDCEVEDDLETFPVRLLRLAPEGRTSPSPAAQDDLPTDLSEEAA
ncbi:MAG: hypothetical protein GYA21_00130 [Myxococcales bacterium]|nr:hypothetical protein [Myxococcales bacterium]